jgi:tRNA-dihydrouridine synthase
MIEHTRAFVEHFEGVKNFAIMKKHFKAYVESFKGAKHLRMALMDTNTVDEVEQLVRAFLATKKGLESEELSRPEQV